MKLPIENWHEAIRIRRSRRKFTGEPLTQNDIIHLQDFTEEISGCSEGFRAVLVTENPDQVFKGAIGSYGKVKAAPAYIAFVGDESSPNVQEKVGYLGECVILEATLLGLSTCWIAGFFSPEEVKKRIFISPSEKVLAVTPVGYCSKNYSLEEKLLSSLAGSHRRKDIEILTKGVSIGIWPRWAIKGLEAARLAPSAVNRQPWRFAFYDGAIEVSLDSPKYSYGISKRLDCGIAMLHFQVGAKEAGFSGRWEYLAEPKVARFLPLGD